MNGHGWLQLGSGPGVSPHDLGAVVTVAPIVNRRGYYTIEVDPKDDGSTFESEDIDPTVLARIIQHILSGDARLARVREPVRFVADLDGRFVCWLP